VMTREHRYDVKQRLKHRSIEVVLWRNLLEPGLDLDLADPYYGDETEFDDCLAVLVSGGPPLLSLIRSRLAETTPE
jgi:protein-tyrosine-phosphatase